MSSFSQRETKPKEFPITTRPEKVDIKTLSEAEKKAFYEELDQLCKWLNGDLVPAYKKYLEKNDPKAPGILQDAMRKNPMVNRSLKFLGFLDACRDIQPDMPNNEDLSKILNPSIDINFYAYYEFDLPIQQLVVSLNNLLKTLEPHWHDR